MRIILASGSPRRKEILHNLSVEFEVITADTDETCGESDPGRYSEQLAVRKGRAVSDLVNDKDALIISADTVVYIDGKILGKPTDEADAKRILSELSGRTHTVATGLSLIMGDKAVSDFEETDVKFAEMPKEFIRQYINSGEPMDKAGAYGIQGRASLWIVGINGDYFNVVGFPVRLFCKLLLKLGIDPLSICGIKSKPSE